MPKFFPCESLHCGWGQKCIKFSESPTPRSSCRSDSDRSWTNVEAFGVLSFSSVQVLFRSVGLAALQASIQFLATSENLSVSTPCAPTPNVIILVILPIFSFQVPVHHFLTRTAIPSRKMLPYPLQHIKKP